MTIYIVTVDQGQYQTWTTRIFSVHTDRVKAEQSRARVSVNPGLYGIKDFNYADIEKMEEDVVYFNPATYPRSKETQEN